MLCFIETWAYGADRGVSLGFGFAAFNPGRSVGNIEGGRPYNFVQVVYVYEKPLSIRELAFIAEPFASYVNKPASGFDLGFDLGLKYYPFSVDRQGFYLTAGPGASYTTIGLKEQGTHMLFLLQGGVGYRYKNFFIEDRFRHYSNGGTANPNWSVHTNTFSVGTLF
jgi:hypothetical protein